MVKNKPWHLRSVFNVNVSMAVAGLKACWAARELGILMKLVEISSLISILIPDMWKKLLIVERVVSILYRQSCNP